MLETAIAEVPTDLPETDDGVWIEALPARLYTTPQYGEVPIPVDKLQRFITNFRQNVRGQEIATDFEHGLDPTKGLQASGWYKDFDIRPSSDDASQMSLYAKVEFTDDAKKDIKDRKYKYWSLEWDDDYMTDTGNTVADVIIGGGLTNRPIAKRTMPINFSEAMWDELDEETQKQFAVWTTKYVNSLPDSAFLYIDSNGRHLPYKDSSGKIDLPHLRNAAARVNQIKGISSATVSRILARIKKLLGNSSKASELAEKYEMDFDVVLFMLSEAAMEHSDPGIAAPLYASAQDQPDPGTGDFVPRVTGDPAADDPAIGNFWRRDPLPNTANIPGDEPMTRAPSGRELQHGVIDPTPAAKPKGQMSEHERGGTFMPELSEQEVTELNELLGVDDIEADDAFMPAVRNAFSELAALKNTVGATSQEREFSEKYPDLWREHNDLLNANRAGNAKTFAESVSRINRVAGVEGEEIKLEPTRNGLSAAALEQVAEVHKKFAEGTATLADFEETIKTITNGGVVEFGEVGSSTPGEEPIEIDDTTAQGIANARKLFAEKVADEQKKGTDNEISFEAAVTKAGEKYPELAAAYRATAA